MEKTETRVAIIAIIISANSTTALEVASAPAIQQLNDLLHDYAEYIIGRMGLPYPSKKVNIINVTIDAPQDTINELSGKIGALDGITAKTVYAPQ